MSAASSTHATRSFERLRALTQRSPGLLSKSEVDQVLAGLDDSQEDEARNLAVEIMLERELTAGARLTLQKFLLGAHRGDEAPEAASTRVFQLQLAEAQEEGSLGGTRIYQEEIKSALLALKDASPGERLHTIHSLMDELQLTTRSQVPTPPRAEEEPPERLEWPSNGQPLGLEALCEVLRDALEQAYTFKRRDPTTDVRWKGPVSLGGLAQGGSLVERLSLASLSSMEADYDLDGLDIVMEIALQLGMEQGRRASLSGITATTASLQMQAAVGVLEEDGRDAREALDFIHNALRLLEELPFEGKVQPLVKREGVMHWPEANCPTAPEALTRPLRQALRHLYSLRRKSRRVDLVWRGPQRLSNLPSLSIDKRLSLDGLRSEQESQGHDALEVLLLTALELGMEQGRKMLQFDHATPVRKLLQMARESVLHEDAPAALLFVSTALDIWKDQLDEAPRPPGVS